MEKKRGVLVLAGRRFLGERSRVRGDIVFRVYGRHEGREADSFFGAFRSRAEAEAEVGKLTAKTMDGGNWAAQYHNRGFVIREHAVSTDFEVPGLPKPRDKYAVKVSARPNRPGTWDSTVVEVLRRNGATHERVGEYVRNYSMLSTFEPFRQGGRELALISREYTKTAVLDLASGDVIAEETESTPGGGFCPVGFYVPDWWDLHDASIIPGSEYWNSDNEWPLGEFGFVWGCYWGDDSSWKVQYLDLRRVQEGIISRDDRFGYVELATSRQLSPCVSGLPGDSPSPWPDFIDVERHDGVTSVRFAVELRFDLASGLVNDEQHAALAHAKPVEVP
jgi:hypothetical protein